MPRWKWRGKVPEARVLCDLLLMIDEDVPYLTVYCWTNRQKVEVDKWASAVHFRASDNNVRVPVRPKVLGSRRRLTR